MTLETNNIMIIVSVLGSVGFGMTMTVIATRKKTKAETLLAETQAKFAETQAKFVEVEMYSMMLNDLKNQSELQGQQILALQQKETEYLKIIREQNSRERGLLKRIKQLESELSRLKNQIQIS